jgi:hypothetical protein
MITNVIAQQHISEGSIVYLEDGYLYLWTNEVSQLGRVLRKSCEEFSAGDLVVYDPVYNTEDLKMHWEER